MAVLPARTSIGVVPLDTQYSIHYHDLKMVTLSDKIQACARIVYHHPSARNTSAPKTFERPRYLSVRGVPASSNILENRRKSRKEIEHFGLEII